MQKKIETAKTLLDALPYLREFYGSVVVIKYGGAAQINPELKEKFAQDIALMSLVGIKPVIIHGGGKRINELLDKLNIHSEFVDGHRVTNEEAMRVVEMVLSGEINKEIVSLLNMHGCKAIGISGKDANCIIGTPKDDGKFGLTGVIKSVNGEVINNLIDEKFIPVIAPIASGEGRHSGFNINADVAATEVAVAIKAKKILFLTDTVGVLDGDKNLIHSLNEAEIEEFKKSGVISGGMIPKVDSALRAVLGGVEKAHIIDGRVEHSLLLELFTTAGIGTLITK